MVTMKITPRQLQHLRALRDREGARLVPGKEGRGPRILQVGVPTYTPVSPGDLQRLLTRHWIEAGPITEDFPRVSYVLSGEGRQQLENHGI